MCLTFRQQGSISVDRHMKAISAEGLYAAGDIARFPYEGENIRCDVID